MKYKQKQVKKKERKKWVQKERKKETKKKWIRKGKKKVLIVKNDRIYNNKWN